MTIETLHEVVQSRNRVRRNLADCRRENAIIRQDIGDKLWRDFLALEVARAHGADLDVHLDALRSQILDLRWT